MDKNSIILSYLCSRLDPDAQAELKQLLGDDPPDIAEDALQGRHGLAFDALPPRLKRHAIARVRPDAGRNDKAFADRYPDIAKVRSL